MSDYYCNKYCYLLYFNFLFWVYFNFSDYFFVGFFKFDEKFVCFDIRVGKCFGSGLNYEFYCIDCCFVLFKFRFIYEFLYVLFNGVKRRCVVYVFESE